MRTISERIDHYSIQYGIRAIAVTDGAGNWAAHIGPSTWTSLELEQDGDKLNETAARQLFPRIPADWEYRK